MSGLNKKDNLKDKKAAKDDNQTLKVPFIDLAHKEIPVEVLKEVPEEAAAFYNFVPIARKGNILEVGMVDTDNLKAKEALRFITRRSGLESKIFAISSVDFENVLRQYQSLRGEVNKALKELEEEIEAEKALNHSKGSPRRWLKKLLPKRQSLELLQLS